VELAARGWEVIGVDVAPRAVAAARQRARDHDIEATFVTTDAAHLREAGLEPGFSLVLDVECLHHVSDDQRTAIAREVDALAAPEADLLLLGWCRGRRGPLPPGLAPDELLAAFPDWQPVHQEPYAGELPLLLRGVEPHWYQLHRACAPVGSQRHRSHKGVHQPLVSSVFSLGPPWPIRTVSQPAEARARGSTRARRVALHGPAAPW
jgi:SAM-dependent methyltransferase